MSHYVNLILTSRILFLILSISKYRSSNLYKLVTSSYDVFVMFLAFGVCCFNSTLGRIIAEQGRNQLTDIDWGVASNPNCRGFTVEEFQRLDLSQMDLSEFTNSIQLPNVENKQTAIIDKINRIGII